ncbi:MAG TPA: glycoside hydrolase family 2 TIM barrel-domain containing protein [Mucilaginibacter sp.]|nr:glycoside hydrolase family 2 TIM barrel-domain containing protein [Mucilaginibacter sp.]
MRKLQQILFATGLIIMSIKISNAQGKYHMQPVPLQTRWAKEVSPTHTHDLYPRPQMVRKNWANLDGLWHYAITSDEASNVPKKWDGDILVPYPIESALSGVKKQLLPNQLLWYKRTLSKPQLKPGEKVLLHFGAVDWQATIYINGKKVGTHTGGYTAFNIDITNYLIKGINEIALRVYDPTDKGAGPHGKQVLAPASIYYTASSGIWQTVWMETVPAKHIEGLVTTPDIDKEILNLTVTGSSGLNFTAIVKDGLKTISTINGTTGQNLQIPIKNPKLWTPTDPHLYALTVTMGDDQVESYFGMRKISIGKDEKGVDRILLNNKFTYNLGTLDQGFWPDGLYTAPTDEALEFDIKAIKAMGFNTIRKHIKVEPARWYYYADKLGMMVWQDMVNPNQGLPAGAREAFENENKEILSQLHNYPSITTWVLFNEKWGQYDQERLTNWIKVTDPSRIVNGHSGEYLYVNDQLRSPSPNAYVNADMTDVHSYPNPMLPIKQSGKAQVCGEFGGIGVAVPGHEWNDLTGWGYVQLLPKELLAKYTVMIKRLKQLKEEGLSGSIYTQPFDVEGEENGLMTYDRAIVKIPFGKLRELHKELTDLSSDDHLSVLADNIDPNNSDERYPELLTEFNNGKRDSAFLRRLTLIARRKEDQQNATKVGNAYIKGLHQPYSKENLDFITQTTRTSQDEGFKLFVRDTTLLNAEPDKYKGQNLLIRRIIGREEITPFLKIENPNWDSIRQQVTEKYGWLGKEKLYGDMMIYYINRILKSKNNPQESWKDSLGIYFYKYYKSATPHSEYNINNVVWQVFENVEDQNVLKFAVTVMKYEIEHFDKNDFEAYDTYANILYKAGNKREALKWEEMAAQGAPDNKAIQIAFEKMKKGKPTWVVSATKDGKP